MRSLLILLVLTGSLAACGKKPGTLDPPEDARNIPFPRTYPTK
jgi:predicted small lipoprotein YifL